jgi:protein transport protein SEC24
MDAPNRPELSKGTVDFAVPSPVYRAPLPPPRLLPASSGIVSPSATPSTSSFFSLPAAPLVPERKAASSLDFVFALDLSLDGVRSGFVRSAATAILEMLYGSDSAFPPYSRVAFVTYDATVHFYDLSVRRS